MSDSPELPYWLALRRAGLGSSNFSLLLSRYGGIREAWQVPAGELARIGMDQQYVAAMTKARATFAPERELELLHQHQARALTWLDSAFPESLKEIPQSPPVLFVRGALDPQFPQAVAVVGTRHVTPYGRQATEHFCEALARAGVAIISGLARGVDAIAHRVALENGAPTVAALAGGIDQIYPRENAGLAERILEHGCLVSEYPVGVPARRDYFPRRNRIVSGLARAALIVEAGEGSGALHTANWAFEQGRDVFAIPGSIFSRQSQGTNQLIRESTARIVVTPEQLCEELNLISAGGQLPLTSNSSAALPLREVPTATPDEASLLTYLSDKAVHIDEIARATGEPIARVSSTLQIMELKGLIRQNGPMSYSKA
ncbi:MAG: DNA-processing protein DprA [Anaerolineaceae bacterium]